MIHVLYSLGSRQQRCWSDCTDVQADLHLCCLHMAWPDFLMTWLKYWTLYCNGLNYSDRHGSVLSLVCKTYRFVANNIRTLHECEVRIENSVPRVTFDITRLCRVMPNSDTEGRNFLSAPNTHVWIFFLHTFRFPIFYLKSSIHYHVYIMKLTYLTSLWRRNDINLTAMLRDVLYNQFANWTTRIFFILPMGKITWIR